MADEKASVQSAKKPAGAGVEPVTAKSKARAPEYTVQELAAGATSIFKGVSPDCVTAALRLARVEKATKEQAVKIVEEFTKRPILGPNEKPPAQGAKKEEK